MKRKSLYHQKIQSLNVFQSFTDLISNAFLILSLFLVLALFQSLELNKRLQAVSPLIIEEKSGQFQFKSGSAELTPELKQYIIIEVVPKIALIIREREIDFIQVIGHTDGQEIYNMSNLDRELENVALSKESVRKLQAGSNADLGLMRALAVVQELKQTGKLKNVNFRAYSAAQLYLPSGELAPIERQANQNRRRIEIRFIPPGQNE